MRPKNRIGHPVLTAETLETVGFSHSLAGTSILSVDNQPIRPILPDMDTANDQITPAKLAQMSDSEIALHASGAYGPGKRQHLMFAIRRLVAGAEIKGRFDGPRAA